MRVNGFAWIVLLGLLSLSAQAFEPARQPLFLNTGELIQPNVMLTVDDSVSMHFNQVSEAYQRVKSGQTALDITDWYVCTGYNPATHQCTTVYPVPLQEMAGEHTVHHTETGITIQLEPFDETPATVPVYVYQGNGTADPVPGAALCNVHKTPFHSDYFLGASGSAAHWESNVEESDIGVLVSRSIDGNGSNDTCVRWKTASTGMPGSIDAYTAYSGEYASYLLTKHASFEEGSLDFSDTLQFPDVDADPANYVPVTDENIIPNLTRIEAARQLSRQLLARNYQQAHVGLFTLDSELDRSCGDGSRPEEERTVLDQLLATVPANESTSPLAHTQAWVNNYFRYTSGLIRYRCQLNHNVVISDGEPDNDSGTLDGMAQSGYDTDIKTTGNDLAGVSWNAAPWQKQNLVTHTVDVGVGSDVLRRTPLLNSIVVPSSDNTANTLRLVAHGLDTGDTVQVGSSYYFAARIDQDRFKIASSRMNAASCAAGNTSSCWSIGPGSKTVSTGPGLYLPATDSDAAVNALSTLWAPVTAMKLPSLSVATNGPALTASSLVFQGYTYTDDWGGELAAYVVNSYGQVNTSVPAWTTKSTLNTPAQRGSLLTWNDVSGSGTTLSWPSLSTAQRNLLVSADTISWLQGNQVAGQRNHSPKGLLGDIANSNIVFVGTEDYGFAALPASAPSCTIAGGSSSGSGCTGAETYAAFRAAMVSRTPLVLAGANDGMLHAFNASTGQEKLGFIPNAVYDKLYALTQPDYQHRYLVDGQIAVSDVFQANSWKTVMVGGLGAGGRSVYALDITDDTFTATDVKWEFTHPSLGYSYGKPVIARFADNRWYAVFANGPGSANEQAGIFVVNLANPADFHFLATNTGGAANPNGMMTVQVKQNDDRTATMIYGGDLQGNLWAFDVYDDAGGVGIWPTSPRRLFTARDVGGLRQAITGGIALRDHPDGFGTMLYFGTGKFIEQADQWYSASARPQVDTVYGVLDNGIYNNMVRADLVYQGLTNSVNYRVVSTNTVNYVGGAKGWFVDLLANGVKQGERVISEPVLDNGRLLFTSIVPSSDPCSNSITGYITVLDALNGSQLSGTQLDTNGDGKIDLLDIPVASVAIAGAAGSPQLIGNASNLYLLAGSTSGVSPMVSGAVANVAGPPSMPPASNPLPLTPAAIADADQDGIPDSIDNDSDNDGVPDASDAFPYDASEYEDFDGDGIGNNSDTDDDNDGVPDVADRFPRNAAEWADGDADGIGDNADQDHDNDGVVDALDPFPTDHWEKADADNDGIGDKADTDDDNDGLSDSYELRMGSDPYNPDSDSDGIADGSDNCIIEPNSDQLDFDADGAGDACDEDDDDDGYFDWEDVFPLDVSEWADYDGDGLGDNADPDDDNDGTIDDVDEYPWDPAFSGERTIDLDGIYDGSSVHSSSSLR